MNLKQSISRLILIGCLFVSPVIAKSPIIIGSEPIDALTLSEYEKRKTERMQKQQQKEAEKEGQRIKDEVRFRPARRSLERVMQALEKVDSYCDKLVFTDYSGANNAISKPDALDAWVDDFINSETRPIKSRLQLDRCMKKTGEWKIDSLHSNQYLNQGLDHQWGYEAQTSTYKSKNKKF